MKVFNTEKGKILLPLLLGIVWIIIFFSLQTVVDFFIDNVLSISKGTRFTESLRFFLFESPKVFLLLVVIVFIVGIIRTFFTPERTRKALEGKSLFLGNILASLLGVVTPFCSCSAIPLFIGFVESGIPLGVTFSFLIASPMINEVAIVLLLGMFGWKTMMLYITTGLFISIMAGYIINKLKLEKWVEEWVFKTQLSENTLVEDKMKFSQRINEGFRAVKDIVGKVWLYVLIGIAVGAIFHGYVPQNLMVSIMGKSAWYAVPLSVLIGIPLYSNAAGIIPIVSVLIEKGAALGTSLAFMMSVIGLSLPELIILRKVLKLPLIITFVTIVGIGIIITGYLFNFIF